MSIYRNTLLATVLGFCCNMSQATQMLTLEASGHLMSGNDEAGFFGAPQLGNGKWFTHTLLIDVDSCTKRYSYGWECSMRSSFSLGGKALWSPSGMGSFAFGPQYVYADFMVSKPFDGGQVDFTSNISADLSEANLTELASPQDWMTLKNLLVLGREGGNANASYAYVVNYDDLNISQLMFTGETAFEKLVVNPVPEPSSIALMGLTTAILAFSRRRKA